MIVDTQSLTPVRRYFVEWCEAAVSWGKGRTVGDPFYQWIVEGRDKGPKYSSCADLGHWGLERVGCTEHWCNRASLRTAGPDAPFGHRGYRSGLNVNLLVARPVGSNPYAESVLPSLQARRMALRTLEPGDIMVTWSGNGSNAHVCVCEFYDGTMVHSYDLGQGPMSVDAWASDKSHLEARKRSRATEYFPLRSVLRLDKVPLKGELDLPSGERLEAVGAYGSEAQG